jgi:hypothetical protein
MVTPKLLEILGRKKSVERSVSVPAEPLVRRYLQSAPRASDRGESTVTKNLGFGFKLFKCEFWLCHLRTKGLRVND